MGKSERSLVDWLRQRAGANPFRVPIGIGDDMAAVRLGGNVVLVTADMLMDGVDFRTAEHTPAQIGRKALAASLSDCAAMAVRPIAALASVALPDEWSMEQARQLVEGMLPLAERHGCPLAGGDTNSWSHPLVIDVIVLAQPWPGLAPVRRTGARPGDGVYVSGPLGGSLGGRHLTFEPRVLEARQLAARLTENLHAMMDISDGLALDLSRLCGASGVGATLDANTLERTAVHADARAASAADGRAPLDHALYDGEDFELLAACCCEDETIETGACQWQRIGEFTSSGLAMRRADGRLEPLEVRGWEHFREEGPSSPSRGTR